jgi:hypothetical protein
VARFIANELDAPVIDCKKNVLYESFDQLFIVNSNFRFCDFRPEAELLSQRAKRVIWCQNDYAISIPNGIKPFIKDTWTTVQGKGEYINWNRVTFHDWLYKAKKPINKVPGLFYWGAFREGRRKSFDTYFNTDLYRVNVSTSSTRPTEFRLLNSKLKMYEPFVNPANLSGFEATIYIEDNTSHKVFCSMANRFYEAISAELPIFVDSNCVKTFEQSGLKVPPGCIVTTAEDVSNQLNVGVEGLWERQKALWVQDYKEDLKVDFWNLYGRLK